jgi:hypothetical protein
MLMLMFCRVPPFLLHQQGQTLRSIAFREILIRKPLVNRRVSCFALYFLFLLLSFSRSPSVLASLLCSSPTTQTYLTCYISAERRATRLRQCLHLGWSSVPTSFVHVHPPVSVRISSCHVEDLLYKLLCNRLTKFYPRSEKSPCLMNQ